MYSIWCNDDVLADDTGEVKQCFMSAVLTEEINSAGKLVFTLSPKHNKRFIPSPLGGGLIRVFRKGVEDWRGRVVQIDVDYYGSRTYTCEGALAFLNDIYFPPNAQLFAGERVYFSDMIKAYNDRCSAIFSLELAPNTGNSYVLTNTLDPNEPRNAKKLLEGMAATKSFFSVVHADSISLRGYNNGDVCAQPCIVGWNISNAKIKIDASSVYTYAYAYGTYTPPGADSQYAETFGRSRGADVYGRIERPIDLGDYGTTKDGWIAYAKGALEDQVLPGDNAVADVEITASAFDMAIARDDMEPFSVGKMAHIAIPTMDIDEDMLITAIRTDLNSPERSTLTLGSTRKKLLSNRLEARYG